MFEILHPKDAIPRLLDFAETPIFAMDTEFKTGEGSPVSRAPITGLSIAGGTPEIGYFGTFWPFKKGHTIHEWGYLRDKVLLPLMGDERRTCVMHPPKVDMQILRARGVSEDKVQCEMRCTMSLVHVYDENLPKGLKDLGKCLLGMRGAISYAKTQKEIKDILGQAKKDITQYLKACWIHYRDHRKKSKVQEVDIDPSWESHIQLVMSLPPKLLKAVMTARIRDKITPIITGHYERMAMKRFSKYGAEDALITLGIYYHMAQRLDPARWPAVDLETQVCYPIVTEMEEHGLRIDTEQLTHIHNLMGRVIKEIRAEVLRRWGMLPALDGESEETEFNPGSPDQVCRIVWDVWGLRPPPWTMQGGQVRQKWRRAKDGYCKVDKNVLGWLKDNAKEPYNENIKLLLDFRSYQKLMSTYVSNILTRATLDPELRVHTSFWPVGARTGRFSSDDPNVENVPRPDSMPEVPMPPGAKWEEPPLGAITDEVKRKRKKERVKVWRVQSLRKIFIPALGWLLVSADLAQVENRLIAHESSDPVLIDLFCRWNCAQCGATGLTDQPLHFCPNCGSDEGARDKSIPLQPPLMKWKCAQGCKAGGKCPLAEMPKVCPKCQGSLKAGGFCLGKDIHAMTAHAVELTKDYKFADARQRAKAVNHAFNYGMGPATLAQREGITKKAATRYLNGLDNTYSMVRQHPKSLHAKVRQDVRRDGSVTMFDGLHRRGFPVARLLMASGNMRSYEWEGIIREAVNALAQGGTGIIMKKAMVNIRPRLLNHENPLIRMTKLVNQVHDELLYEAPAEVAQEVLSIVNHELEHAVQLQVPIISDGAIGKTWGDAH